MKRFIRTAAILSFLTVIGASNLFAVSNNSNNKRTIRPASGITKPNHDDDDEEWKKDRKKNGHHNGNHYGQTKRPEHKPSTPAHKPAVPDHKPSAPAHKPSAPEHRPPAPAHKPSAPEYRPPAPRPSHKTPKPHIRKPAPVPAPAPKRPKQQRPLKRRRCNTHGFYEYEWNDDAECPKCHHHTTRVRVNLCF